MIYSTQQIERFLCRHLVSIPPLCLADKTSECAAAALLCSRRRDFVDGYVPGRETAC